MYYWANEFAKKIWFELAQLDSVYLRAAEMYDRPDKMYEGKVNTGTMEKIKRMMDENVISIPRDAVKYSVAVDLARAAIDSSMIADGTITSGVDTRTATAVKYAERKKLKEARVKSTQYNIIRRPKCSNMSG